MQLAQLNRTVVSSGIAKQQKMGMILDGTAFKILSDGLYSDKIGSMVRETYSNAVDSHIMAGQPDKPGWVQLPTQIDPTFVVRDEGIGLDEEGVMEVATTYFRSTKRTDNAAIGGFGLGFKSPFAYADAWTIVATKGGFKRTFSAYMTETGEPNVAMLTEERTNQPDGVEVRVPVKRQDISAFHTAVAKQLRFFNPRPIMSGAPGDFSWPSPEFFIIDEAAGFKLRKGDNGWSRNNETRWTVVSGPVGFPLDTNMFSSDARLSQRARNMINSLRGEVFFNVGEIMPAPSREAIQYNPQTVTALVERFNKLPDVIAAYVKHAIGSAADFWSASLEYERITDGLGYQLKSLMEGYTTFNNRPLNGTISCDGTNFPGLLSTRLSVNELVKERIPLNSATSGFSFPAKDNWYLLIDDLPSWHHRQSTRVSLWYQSFDSDKRPHGAVFVRVNSYAKPDTIDRAIKFLEGFPKERIVYLSSIALPEAPKAAKTQSKSLPGLREVTRGRVSSGMCSKADADDCSVIVQGTVTPGYYVVTEHNQLPPGASSNLINDTSFLPGKLYFVPKSLVSRIDPEEGWIDFISASKKWLDDNQNDVLAAMKVQAESQIPNNLPWGVTKLCNQLLQLGFPIPDRTRSSFLKLYRDFAKRKAVVLSSEQQALIHRAILIDDAHWGPLQLEMNKASEKACLNIYKEFTDTNKLFAEVLSKTNYNFSDEIVADLVRKLA